MANPIPHEPRSFPALQAALLDWVRTDGLTWIYVLKALTAAFLALGIAMRLDLPQPRTAMTTVFIVMQPQSGAILAKSFYRIGGTLVGLVATLFLIAVFAPQRELFLGALALWTGICTAGAARNRNFRSYGFLLAGYTAALIGIPAAQHPDGAFLSALTRAAEVTLGVLCAGFVGGTRSTAARELANARRQCAHDSRHSSNMCRPPLCRARRPRADRAHQRALSRRHRRLRSDAQRRRLRRVRRRAGRSGRLARLNSEFMTASTRFHALHQLMNRLRDAACNGGRATRSSLTSRNSHRCCIAPGEPVLSAADAAGSAAQARSIQGRATAAACARRARAGSAARLCRCSTSIPASELLYRFVDDMHAYALTYASLAVGYARARALDRSVTNRRRTPC